MAPIPIRRALGPIAWCALCLGAPGAAGQSTWYVDDDGSNGNGGTSSSDAWQTLSYASTHASVSSGDTIVVLSGTYDEGLGESFPIRPPCGVTILGSDDGGGQPLIGGDVNDDAGPDAVACFLIEADTTLGDCTDVVLSDLTFAAEVVTNRNAPAAVRIEVSDDANATGIEIEDCIIRRLGQGGTVADRQPALHFIGGKGDLQVEVRSTRVVATEVGGIGAFVGEGTEGLGTEEVANLDVLVESVTVSVAGAETADYGVQIAGIGAGADEKYARIVAQVLSSTVDSTGATGDGIGDGIVLRAAPVGLGHVTFNINDTRIEHNVVEEVSGDGLSFLVSDGNDAGSQGYITCADFFANEIRGSGGSGVVMDFGDSAGNNKYLHIESVNNLVVESTHHGFLLKNADTSGSAGSGFVYSVNDTVADNGGHGLFSDSTSVDHLPGTDGIENSIYYGNDGTSGVQMTNSDDSWTPTFDHSCVEDWVSGGTGNNDGPPQFAGSGSYKLTSSSTDLIDGGDNSPSPGLLTHDIAGTRRILAGDCSPPGEVDMGAYEYVPVCN